MHAMKLFDFVLARDCKVDLLAIDQPTGEFKNVAEVFEKALQQEQEVSRQIDTLYEIAFHEKAFSAAAELQWFLTEQVEEEKTAREIVAKFRMVGNDPASLLDLDRDLGARTASEAASQGMTMKKIVVAVALVRVGCRLQQGKWRGPTVHTTAGSPGCGRSAIQPASCNRSERDSRADQGARLRRIRRTRAWHQR